jgi:hypothetical protein
MVDRPSNHDDDTHADEAVRTLRRALVEHPEAARAAFGWLVREGRAYARTAEGERLLRRMVRSEYVTRLQSTWEILSCGTDGDEARPPAPFASAAIEAVVRAVFRRTFESRIHDALRGRPTRRGQGSP